jgi:hypothetical protein
MMTLPIVRTACRTGQTAVASIAFCICCRDYVFLSACSLSVLLMESMRLAKQHRNLAPAFYERHDFASQPPHSLERLYYLWRGMSSKNSCMDDQTCPDLTNVRANVYYTSDMRGEQSVRRCCMTTYIRLACKIQPEGSAAHSLCTKTIYFKHVFLHG